MYRCTYEFVLVVSVALILSIYHNQLSLSCAADELQNIYVPQSDQCKKNEFHLDPKKEEEE
jgi:CTP:phosphocholine cytidylyltransferase-like protein